MSVSAVPMGSARDERSAPIHAGFKFHSASKSFLDAETLGEHVMTREACGFKIGVSGSGTRRVVVSAVKADGRPIVHVKTRDGVGHGSKAVDTIDLSLTQAAALADALNAAIRAAGKDPIIEEAKAAESARLAAQQAQDQAWEAAAPAYSNLRRPRRGVTCRD
ncbi:hypothetical protein MKK58_00285 [Methylobacterium sp. J-078]|uniref:hypothetical protein n=1 Tax=Methylobacterium sp. J-078 TaxID=2836657 RepID=UPI001FBB75E5|nr:hypothetical protein [Methylobacterium sp. J-078]MCJ2042997.1 hypothetical protein [Methylobacterium sp. J-078]